MNTTQNQDLHPHVPPSTWLIPLQMKMNTNHTTIIVSYNVAIAAFLNKDKHLQCTQTSHTYTQVKHCRNGSFFYIVVSLGRGGLLRRPPTIIICLWWCEIRHGACACANAMAAGEQEIYSVGCFLSFHHCTILLCHISPDMRKRHLKTIVFEEDWAAQYHVESIVSR